MTERVNHCGLDGIEFTEFSSPEPEKLHNLFLAFGFSRLMTHADKKIDLYKQGDIYFLLNKEEKSFSQEFYKSHGPCVSSMGWRVKDATSAFETATSRGAKAATGKGDYSRNGNNLSAIYGIGDSLIYFVDDYTSENKYEQMGFVALDKPDLVEPKGFVAIDHLTNNVYEGTLETWSNFYKSVFGFTEVRYFDIKGAKTGLVSFALQSPCENFCIPINEGTDKKSQINEYLEEYKGPGVQHIAFLSTDIVRSLESMKGTDIETLDIDDQYYQEVFDRVPNVTEDHKKLQDLQILVDGDEEGYLLQIFTKNVVGPIFIEIIQRKNHNSFGEGNFGALFRSIERDQAKRGYLD
ncbi:4-hydroxyphenylpyruvate dioxygenase [bacterium]|nr:4-hydroxyphenylpyruvate dioxygenase [bacterium]